jgi:REP element-mobilizing transposase RayT
MPNHIHGIVFIQGESIVGAHGCAPLHQLYRPPHSLGSFISGFKSSATKRIYKLRNSRGHHIWQRNYFDRIIRNERELMTLRRYIDENPLKWALDQYINRATWVFLQGNG